MLISFAYVFCKACIDYIFGIEERWQVLRSKRLELLENIIEFLSEFAQRKCGIYREFRGAQFRVDGLFNHSFKGFFEEWILLGEKRESGSVFMSAKLF